MQRVPPSGEKPPVSVEITGVRVPFHDVFDVVFAVLLFTGNL